MAINSGNNLNAKKERRRYKIKNGLTVGTWNVRTLVESTEDERVCRKRVIEAGNNLCEIDRKLDL